MSPKKTHKMAALIGYMRDTFCLRLLQVGLREPEGTSSPRVTTRLRVGNV